MSSIASIDTRSIVSIDTRGYDISMGPGFLRVGGGGGIAGNVYINGNVGIGKTNPAATLDVNGGVNIGGTPNLGNSGGYRLLRLTPPTGNATQITFDQTNTTGTTQNYIYSDNTKMEIQTPGTLTVNGNVGIGTNPPTARLEVAGTIKTTDATASGNTTTGALVVAGGAGIGGAVNIGGTLTSTGSIIANNALTLGNVQTLNFGVPRTAYITSGLNSAGSLDILNQVTGATSRIRLGTNNNTSTGITIDNTGLLTANNGLTMGGANNITLGTGTTAPTVGQLGYIYSGTITWAGGAGNGVASIDLSAGTYIGTFSVILGGTFVANNYIAVSNLGYTARFPIINVASGTDSAMCNGSFTIRLATSSTTITLTNGIGNSQTLVSQHYRIVKIA